LSCCLNDSSDDCEVSVVGRPFHTCAAATGKARSPRVRRRVIGTSSSAFVRLLLIFTALVVSKVDYCCSVLAGVSGHLLDRLQSILNAAARLNEFSASAPNASPCFSATFIGCGSRNGFNSVSAFWHSDVSMDQRRHISLRAFIGQPMWKVVATSAHHFAKS